MEIAENLLENAISVVITEMHCLPSRLNLSAYDAENHPRGILTSSNSLKQTSRTGIFRKESRNLPICIQGHSVSVNVNIMQLTLIG